MVAVVARDLRVVRVLLAGDRDGRLDLAEDPRYMSVLLSLTDPLR